MAVSIAARADSSLARAVITAEGGVIGDAFFIGRRGRDGILSLVRETSESSKVWQRDPAGQRSNLFTRPRFELTTTAQRLYTNLFRNPNLVADPAVNNVLRTNLAANPGFEENIRFQPEFGSGGTGSVSVGNYRSFSGASYLRTTWASRGLYGGAFANSFEVVPGRAYAVSVYVRTSVMKRMRVVMSWSGGAAAQSLGADTVVPAYSSSNTGWTRLTWTGTAPAGTISAVVCAYLTEGFGQTWLAKEWLDVDAMLIEVGTAIGDYFDGSFGAIEDPVEGRLLSAWTGTANNSSSVMYPARVLGVTGENANIRLYGDSVAIIPSAASNASAALMDHGNSMTAGKTYTIATTASVLARSGTVNANAGSITVTSKNSAGAVISTQKSISVGVGNGHQFSHTFTIPALTTTVEVRLVNGASVGKGTMTFKNFRIFEGSYDPGFFSGATPNIPDLAYSWISPTVYDYGTIGQSGLTSVPPAGGFVGNNAVPIASKVWKKNGASSMRLFPTSDSNDSYVIAPAAVVTLVAGKTYTFLGTQRQTQKLTGNLHPDSRRVRVTGTGMTTLLSTQPGNTAARTTAFKWVFTVPAGATNIRMEFVHGGINGSGDLYWDEVMVTEGNYTGSYFDGEFPNSTVGGWNGTKDASTSYRYGDSLPIEIYDYETRQGQDVEYFVLDSKGVPVTEVGAKLRIPEWGTWLKDPFRPHLNLKLWFNSDDSYTRQANRVLLQPRGSKFPIAQWERRTAPEGKIRFLTESADDARRLTTLVEECGVLFLDVAEDFGVPFRYAALGDVIGMRAVNTALRDPHRFWDIEMQEVAMPIGEPSTMSATYENLMNTFATYLTLRSSVKDYSEVADGAWI